MTSMDDDARPPDAPQYVAAHLHDLLAGDPRLALLDVEVRVVGTKVFVGGAVTTEERRAVVGELAASHLPQYEIHNELVVTDCPEVTAGEIEHLT